MTEEMLAMLKECGESQTPLEEALEIVELEEDEFFKNKEAIKAYRTGQLLTKMRIRQSVIKLAKDGVPQAVKLYHEKYDQDVIDDETE